MAFYAPTTKAVGSFFVTNPEPTALVVGARIKFSTNQEPTALVVGA